jgi:hypothetical protein
MKHVIQHDLDMPTARRVADRAFDSYKQRFAGYDPSMSWVSETRAEVGFNAKGVKIAGTMVLEDKTIEVDLDVPFLLRPFKNIALETIEREVRVWVGKAQAGEL